MRAQALARHGTADRIEECQWLIRLSAQESRNVELILFGRVMHSARPAMLIQALRQSPLGIFRDWFRARLGRAWHGPARQPIGTHLRGARRLRHLGVVFAAAKADRRQSLQ